MSQAAQSLLNEIQARRQHNLAFFKKHFPNVYQGYANATLKKASLNISPSTLAVELLEEGKALYSGHPEESAKFNAQALSDDFKEGNTLQSVVSPSSASFLDGRFSHAAIKDFLISIDENSESLYSTPYLLEKTIPMVVFFGCGLGHHIKEFLNIRNVNHALLVEYNPERFIASLYTTDWAALIQPFLDDPGKSFAMNISGNPNYAFDLNDEKSLKETGDRCFYSAWSTACEKVPFFPIQVITYNHLGDPVFNHAIAKLRKEMEKFLNVWGYYDDEINQLNHVLHNLRNQQPLISHQDFSKVEKIALICGNGSSLDDYIDIIKEHREKITVISAGSTIHTLLKHDIYPDVEVTLESDLNTYEAFKASPVEKTRQVTLIGAAQIHPDTFDLFKEGLIYAKGETAYGSVFARKEQSVVMGTPSATNAALAFAVDYKFKDIYLVGMDFGFVDAAKSHATGAFYDDEDIDDVFKAYKKTLSDDSYRVETNQFGDIYTTAFYNTSRKFVEIKLRINGRKDVINLSKGASIEGTEFKDSDYFIEQLEKSSDHDFDLVTELKKQTDIVSSKELDRGILIIENYLKSLSKACIELTEQISPTRESIDRYVFEISQLVNQAKQHSSLHMIMRGTIWAWLFIFYAQSKRKEKRDDLERVTFEWKRRFIDFMEKLPKHMKEYISDEDGSDERLGLTITKAEPNVEKWLFKDPNGDKKSA